MTKNQEQTVNRVSTVVCELEALEKNVGPDALRAAVLARAMLAEMDVEGRETRDAVLLLATKIAAEMPNVDEPRFSAHDYADAVANATIPVDVVTLSELDPTALEISLIFLAAHKRESYENRPHETPIPPGLPLRKET